MIADLVHANKIPLIVDNTLVTPYLICPFKDGADIIVHSTTKYLNGHSSAIGGTVVDSGKFNWPEEKYPDSQIFKERKRDLAYIDKVWREIRINCEYIPCPDGFK